MEIRTSTALVRPYTAVHRLGGALVYGPCTRPSCPGARAPPGELSRTARTRGDGMRAPPDNCPGQPVLPYTPYITYTLTIRTRSVQPRTRRTAPYSPYCPYTPVHARTRDPCALPTGIAHSRPYFCEFKILFVHKVGFAAPERPILPRAELPKYLLMSEQKPRRASLHNAPLGFHWEQLSFYDLFEGCVAFYDPILLQRSRPRVRIRPSSAGLRGTRLALVTLSTVAMHYFLIFLP